MVNTRFLLRRKKVRIPKHSNLRDRVAFAIWFYLRVRGVNKLLHPETVLVVRKNFDIFLMEHRDRLDNPEDVIGVFRLQDADCYAEFEDVFSDAAHHSAALAKMTLGHIASQLADRVIQEVNAPAGQSAQSGEHAVAGDKQVILLTTPAAAAGGDK